jgi:pimeloyl-ACP methyl ester carboxylesterase
MPSYQSAPEVCSVTARDGVRLEYEVLGSGPPLVLLHGLFAGRAAFSRQQELADTWTLMLPSMRAHDRTDGRLPADYGIATTELDDLCRMLDAAGLERFHLVGHSSGGTLAYAFARQFPDRVERLVLIEPTLFGLLADGEREEIADVFLGFAKAGRRDGDRAGLATALEWLGGDAWRALDDAKKGARLDAMAPMAHLLVPHMESLVAFDASVEDLGDFPMPTLLVYGGASYPVEAQIAKRFRQARPDWEQVTVEGAGHNCFREQPAVVNAAIRRFLAG